MRSLRYKIRKENTLITYKDNEGKNISLSARYYLPPEEGGKLSRIFDKDTAVIAHPHPEYGGNMENNVTRKCAEYLAYYGLRCLTFNFRSAEHGSSYYTGGPGEIEDFNAAVEKAAEVTDGVIFAIGYSFGAIIALESLRGLPPEKIPACALICYPFGFMDIEPYYKTDRPLLFIFGEKDNIAPISAFDPYRAKFKKNIQKVEIIAGADHFLWGHEYEAAEKVKEFLVTVKNNN